MHEANIILTLILTILVLINLVIKSWNYFFINLFNLMNSIGAIYYTFEGQFYKPPQENALTIVLITFIIVNLAYIIYAKFPSFRKNQINISKKNRDKPKNYFLLFILPPIIYFVIFKEGFSLYQKITGTLISESNRADVSGSLPNFYTFSVFVTSLAIPYSIEMFKKAKNFKKYIFFILLIFFSMLLGNKSTILTIFFFLYLYDSQTHQIKFNFKKIFFFSMIFILIYTGIKFAYYGNIPGPNMIFQSIFRRVMVINTSVYGNFIDYFVIQGNEIPLGFSHIKQFMFYYIYGYLPGGASVNYLGSILYYTGFGLIQSLIVFFSTFYILFFRDIIITFKMVYFKETLTFLNFYGAIILVNGYISDYIIRVFVPMVFFIILDKISINYKNSS